jgi:hypothetical protein
MWYIAVFFLASVFYYIGDHEYHQKGWLLALISVGLSYGITVLTPSLLIGVLGINVLFFLGIWIFNIFSGKPPRSSSGF